MTRSHARRMRELLRSVFGLEQLRPGQRAVIDSVLSGRHTLAVMPTGAGKSLCYQLPALLLPGMTVVVSPLIALMRDQHDKLIALGVASAQVNSAVPADVARQAHAQIGDEGTEFFFTTPEQLARPELREKLMQANVDLFVIDEAHCLSHWGHDFRPDYLGLADVVRSLGSPTVLALTATAPPAVAVDIVRQLALPDMAFLTTGAWRENLELAVRHVSGDVDKQRALVDVLRRQSGSGIVYAATVKHVHEIADSIDRALSPRGVFVVIQAEHLCMTMRGVKKAGAVTVTSAVRGLFRSDARTRQEFLAAIDLRNLSWSVGLAA